MNKLYLLGKGIAHSKSAVMYNAVYPLLGVDWSYAPFDCAEADEARRFLCARDFRSTNITSPYKPLAYQVADILGPSAILAQGANLLIAHSDVLFGYNVDGVGCVDYLQHAGVDFKGKRVAVCGTGPTALAIFHACALAKAGRLALVSRSADRARGVLAHYCDRYSEMNWAKAGNSELRDFSSIDPSTCFLSGDYSSMRHEIAEADIVIDATILGMRPGDPAPFDPCILDEDQTVMDVVYGHGETAMLAGARERGCRTFDGAGMLVGQAVATVQMCFAAAGLEVTLSPDELFERMADAAGFEC